MGLFCGSHDSGLQEEMDRWEIDVIAPVPLHPKKRRYRGFNQAELRLFR